MATAVEVEASLKRDGLLHITLRKRLSRLGLEVVETVDVSLVVLGVVHFHDLTRNGRLQSTVRVRQLRKGVLGTHTHAGEHRSSAARDKSEHDSKWQGGREVGPSADEGALSR